MKKHVDFDDYAKDYDTIQRENLGIFGSDLERFASYKVKFFKRHLSHNPKSILEFGCGTGRNLPFLSSAFHSAKIFACDISKDSLAAAEKFNPNLQFFHIDTPESFFTSSPEYEACFLAGVLHHIQPEERFSWIEVLVNKLVSGGTFAVFEHNPFNPVTRRLVNTCPYDRDASLLSPDLCKSLLQKYGLSICLFSYTLLFPWRNPLFESIESLFSKLPLGGQYCILARKK